MKTIFSLIILFFSALSFGQMLIENDTLYGNEWIDYDKTYFKISVAEDGVYRISGQELLDSGAPINEIEGKKLRLHYLGEEYPLYVSNEGVLNSDDYLEFVGVRNRSELDQHLYEDGMNDLLNTQYSLFNDTSAYFLSWDDVEDGLQFESSNISDPSLSSENYILVKDINYYNDFFMKPSDTYKVRYSDFRETEGFGGPLQVNHSFTVSPTNLTSGPDPSLSIRFGSLSGTHIPVIQINGSEVYRDTFNGFVLKDLSLPITSQDLANPLNLKLDGTYFYYDAGVPQYFDKTSVSEIRLTYPQSTTLNGVSYKEFYVEASNENKKYELTGFNIQNGIAPIVYDLALNQRIITDIDGDKITFILAAGDERKIQIINPENLLPVNKIEERNFIDYSEQNASYLFITHEKLIDGVQSYMNYRSQEYTTAVATVDQIYDQYGYGINRHSLSLRNFGNYTDQEWTDLEYAMIIGKGITYETFRKPDQIAEHKDKFFVPTFGTPGSDNLIFSKGAAPDGEVIVGRLAARNDQHISNYLQKVILNEQNFDLPQTIADRAWMKNVIHLSGGDITIQLAIKNFLNNMEVILEENGYGANVRTFYKTSSDNLQNATSTEILNLIKRGTPIITFFGHSAVGTFDFSLEQPEKWLNKGRNPIILSLGCYSGNIHSDNTIGLSEEFVLEPEHGAIAFVASAGTAYVGPQAIQGAQLYDVFGTTGLKKTVGHSLSEVRKLNSQNANLDTRSVTQQFTFHGDPAIRLYGQDEPDYVLDYSTVKTNPALISSGDESFEFSVDVVNLGANIKDTLDMQFIYQLPESASVDTMNLSFRDTIFRHRISLEVPIDGIKSLGKNTIYGKVDVTNKIAEGPQPEAELNNSLKSETNEEGYCFLILDNTAKPAYPCEFDIVTESDLTLKAATSNAYTPQQKYVFEIDTTEYFNSPIKEREVITQGGGLIEWKPNLVLQDNHVYYWRVSPDSTSIDNPFIWHNTSFLYNPGSQEGWNQSHYFQYLKDDLLGLDFNEEQEMIFDTTSFSLEIVNALWDQSTVGLKYNNGGFSASTRPWRIMDAGIAFSVVDPNNGIFWENKKQDGTTGGLYGSIDANAFSTFRSFAYPTNTLEEREKAIEFLTNIVPDDHFVYVYTIMNTCDSDFAPEEWAADSLSLGTNLFQILEGQGAGFVRELELKGSVPYNFIYQKGNMNPMGEHIASICTDYIKTKVINPFLKDQGSLETVTIGPAQNWDRVEWRNKVFSGADSTSIDILIYDISGEIDTTYTFKGHQGGQDLSFIDAQSNPNIKIRYNNEDLISRTSPQLEYLKVYYTGYPDIGFDPETLFEFNKDTLQRGEEFSISYDVRNLSKLDVDSITIKYSLLDSANNVLEFFKKEGGINAGQNNTYTFTHPTFDMLGNYQITVEINTEGDQPEKQRFNNVLLREFYVEDENINPLLDITFDGTHILDGDIISPSPLINISLKDENPYLPLNDPEVFELVLWSPSGIRTELSLDDPSIQFIAGTEEENTARIEYTPTFVEEGEYELSVRGRDATGNFSGDNELVKRFNVILEEKVTNVINYPNPFSTSTRFVFTLTGSTLPDIFNIRIMTMSGKVVREITKDELGPLKIGLNKTSFAWNGTDEYGEQLANGVYLYKAFIKYNNSEEIEHLETSLDQFFNKGYGKLVIMR